MAYPDKIAELNGLIQSGDLVVTTRGLFGATGAATKDGRAAIRELKIGPAGRAGAIFYHLSGWELISSGQTVAKWLFTPGQVEESTRAYCRATRWLWLKCGKPA